MRFGAFRSQWRLFTRGTLRTLERSDREIVFCDLVLGYLQPQMLVETRTMPRARVAASSIYPPDDLVQRPVHSKHH